MSPTSVRSKSRSQSSAATTTPQSPQTRGRVIYVGTGPGDPDLLTLGAIAALADASVVILDDESQQDLLTPSCDHSRRRCGDRDDRSVRGRQATQSVGAGQAHPQAHRRRRPGGPARLGDPFLDNAIADEAAACVRGGADFEVVPGVSSLTAVPEYAGIDLSHTGGVHFASILRRPVHQNDHFPAVGQHPDPGDQHQGAEHVRGLVDAATAAGRPDDDHVLATLHGGSTEQLTIATTLSELPPPR